MSGVSSRTLKLLSLSRKQNTPCDDTLDSIHQEKELTRPKNAVSEDANKISYLELPEDNTKLFSPHTPMLSNNAELPLMGDHYFDYSYQDCSVKKLTPLKNVVFENINEINNPELTEIDNTNNFSGQRATTSSYNNSGLSFYQEVGTINDLDSDDTLKDPNYSDEGIVSSEGSSNESTPRGSENKPESNADSNKEENNADEQEDETNTDEQEDETNTDEQEKENIQTKRKSRKRTRDTENWKCNIRKRKRYAGEEYISKKNTRVKERKVGQPCKDTCSRKCSQKILPETRNNIFKEFWSSSRDINQKRQFIASSIETPEVKKRRPRTGENAGKRNTTNQYFFIVRNEKIRVCKIFFLHTLDISQSFVNVALSKQVCGGMVSEDKRGRKIPPNKIEDKVRDGVRTHICKFPVIESHYSRERTSKKYLGIDLNISRMYELYMQECIEDKIPEEAVSKKWLYENIFNTEFNYAFKLPNNDTCDLCDEFLIKLQDSDITRRQTIQQEYDEHFTNSKERYDLKKADKINARESPNSKVIMVDLEKCLPTPMLTNAQSFYSLKLWTFNYTIRDSTTNKTYCCMWDETLGGRGGNEMASCLLKWALTNIPSNIEVLTIWSDNCVSQNRNINAVLAYFFILKSIPTSKVINHKYLLRGHTHLEVDCDHSVIEREKKKMPQFKIITPWDWQQFIRIASRSNPFTVISMEIEDFKIFKALVESSRAPYVLKKKTTDGQDFKISEVVHMQVRANDIGVLYFKTNFVAAEFNKVDFNRISRSAEFPQDIPAVRDTLKPISTKKFQHLQKLLPWVPRIFHAFYKNLHHQDNIKDE